MISQLNLSGDQYNAGSESLVQSDTSTDMIDIQDDSDINDSGSDQM